MEPTDVPNNRVPPEPPDRLRHVPDWRVRLGYAWGYVGAYVSRISDTSIGSLAKTLQKCTNYGPVRSASFRAVENQVSRVSKVITHSEGYIREGLTGTPAVLPWELVDITKFRAGPDTGIRRPRELIDSVNSRPNPENSPTGWDLKAFPRDQTQYSIFRGVFLMGDFDLASPVPTQSVPRGVQQESRDLQRNLTTVFQAVRLNLDSTDVVRMRSGKSS